jgi:hypothetical protein
MNRRKKKCLQNFILVTSEGRNLWAHGGINGEFIFKHFIRNGA